MLGCFFKCTVFPFIGLLSSKCCMSYCHTKYLAFKNVEFDFIEYWMMVYLFFQFYKLWWLLVIIFILTSDLYQKKENPELARGAAKALYDLYEVVTHELLSPDLRYMILHMMQNLYGMITLLNLYLFVSFLMLQGAAWYMEHFGKSKKWRETLF